MYKKLVRSFTCLVVLAVMLFNTGSILASPKLPSSLDDLTPRQRREFEEFMEDIETLRPYIELSEDGIPSLTISRSRALQVGIAPNTYNRIKASMAQASAAVKSLPQHERPIVVETASGYEIRSYGSLISQNDPQSRGTRSVSGMQNFGCVHVSKGALQTFAWFVIAVGGVEAALGGFVSGTIAGLPAGAVLGALGISLDLTGGYLLWWVDNNYPDEGRTICL